MRLAEFILRDMEAILREWEAFAATLFPAATRHDATGLARPRQTDSGGCGQRLVNPPDEASSGRQIQGKSPELARSTGNSGRNARRPAAKSGFDINQLAAEYRALPPASFACGWTHVGPTNLKSGGCRPLQRGYRPGDRRIDPFLHRPGGPCAQLVARDVGARHAAARSTPSRRRPRTWRR